MEWNQLPWASIIGAAIPLLGVIWSSTAGRGNRMAAELESLDKAIGAAVSRNDSLQHAYRAVALERLYRVHQRDRSSRGLGAAVFWAIYAFLFFFLAFSTFEPTTQAWLIVYLGGAASAAMSFRAWNKWVHGKATLEANANLAYLRALTDARRQFVAAADAKPDLEAVPTPKELAYGKLNKIDRTTLRVMTLFGALLVAAGFAATYLGMLVNDLDVMRRILIGVSLLLLASMSWSARRWFRRARETISKIFPERFLLWPLLAILAAFVVWLAWLLAIWTSQGIVGSTQREPDTPAWILPFYALMLLTFAVWVVIVDRFQVHMPKIEPVAQVGKSRL